jgi:hypothetical protein
MDAAQFLARVVPPGNYVAVCFKKPAQHRMGVRFFPRDNLKEAASFIRWAPTKNHDTWFGLANYTTAEVLEDGKLTGRRTQENVQSLRSFWIDLDIKRPGDKKTLVHADLPSAVGWLKNFCAGTALPIPNLWVNSGYGLHLYWITEDPMTPEVWQPYAEALKAALVANNAIGDIGLSADSARILRPPETLNFKDPANPKPVSVLKQSPEIPNQVIYDKLQPYMALAANYGNGISSGSGALAGGPSAVMAQRSGSLATPQSLVAAQANMPARAERFLAAIATKCHQVRDSLATSGAGDSYSLWYLGHLSLAHFCADGNQLAHDLSRGDPRYSSGNVDHHLQQVAAEHQRKGTGAPTCAKYDTYRTGVCRACPHWGKINSPLTLGVEHGDLPAGYRRAPNAIERRVVKGGEEAWVKLIDGDVFAPILDRKGGDYILTFTYEFAGKKSYVTVDQGTLPSDAGRLGGIFCNMGVTLYGVELQEFARFTMFWIKELRAMCAVRETPVPAFGWAKENKTYIGFSVGGTLYKQDGTIEVAPGGDARINEAYQPRGDLQAWKDACKFVIDGRPELQVLVAAAFAAPLMEFTGETGVTLSAWSTHSGVGKSSALKVGQAVWGSLNMMCSMEDTHNAARKIIASTRVMPCYWDEMRISDDARATEMLDMFFEVAQGKDKARLYSDTTLREIGEWRTLLVSTSNRPFMDHIIRDQSTDAGAVRLFEFPVEQKQLVFSTQASRIVRSLEDNTGQAGKVYAAFISTCQQTAAKLVEKCAEMIHSQVQAVPSERLYIAGVSAILAGSHLARTAGLYDFDIPAMRDFLVVAFKNLRARRTGDLTVSNGVVDYDKIIGNFFADHSNEGLITNEFHNRGRPNKNFTVVRRPTSFNRLAFHIGQRENMVRIDKQVFIDWCRKHKLAASPVIDQLKYTYGATETRAIMAGGTDYATGRVDYIAVPMTTPELAQYIYDFSRYIQNQTTQAKGATH